MDKIVLLVEKTSFLKVQPLLSQLILCCDSKKGGGIKLNKFLMIATALAMTSVLMPVFANFITVCNNIKENAAATVSFSGLNVTNCANLTVSREQSQALDVSNSGCANQGLDALVNFSNGGYLNIQSGLYPVFEVGDNYGITLVGSLAEGYAYQSGCDFSTKSSK